ncbi:hypothetical protein [Marinomonas ostreistagni]|uniref:DUF4214 domain-containing protein n=1 Tax=Marinomonas ostreistagni TaxID=359209 RepID=A0ABS0ZCV0_9GAMM|nr:hypothetical protein [Marinomonas ostreistagni]MBJ7551502.1 hypothetical protein [Marinomonas ostreistagni]
MSTRNDVLSIIVGTFSGAPTASLLERFIAQVENGQSLSDLTTELVATSEFDTFYPDTLSHAQFASAFLTAQLPLSLREDLLPLGIEYMVAQLEQGASRAEVVYSVIESLISFSNTDPVWGTLKLYFDDSVALGDTFARTSPIDNPSLHQLRQIITSRSLDGESSITAEINEQDVIYGTDANDAFSIVLANATELNNNLTIEAGEGTDELVIELESLVGLGSHGLEHITLVNASGENIAFDATTIDTTLESLTLASVGELSAVNLMAPSSELQLTAELTQESVEITFDSNAVTQQHGIAASVQTGSALVIEVLDFDSPTGQWLNNGYIGLAISLNGITYELVGDAPFQSHAELLQILQDAIQEQGLEEQLKVSYGSQFSKISSDNGETYVAPEIILTSTSGELLNPQWLADGILPWGDVHTAIYQPELDGQAIANLTLNQVGANGESVDILIGAENNEQDIAGINYLNLDLIGINRLENIASTNNALNSVSVTSESSARLTLNGLDDIASFTVSGGIDYTFMTATLTEASLEKYSIAETDFTYQMSNGADRLYIYLDESLQQNEDLHWIVDTQQGNDKVWFATDFAGTLTVTSLAGQVFDLGKLYLTGVIADQIELDFSAYLTTYQADDKDHTALASSYVVLEASGENEIAANSIVSFDVDSEVYELLTETSLIEVFNGLTEIGELSDQSLDASVTEADLSSQSTGDYDDANREYLLIVENSDSNEFKAFQLLADVGESDFSKANLIGSYDFGEMSVAEILA